MSDEYRDKSYASVPYEDFSARQARMKEEGRYEKIGAKILWWFYIFVVLIIPFAWFIGGLFFDTIAAFTIVWVLCSFIYRIAKEFDWIKESDVEKKKSEKQRTMEHYYYHCERNPCGFEKLKIENFEQDAKDKNIAEYQRLRENGGLA